jgi:hypothetical protein
VGNRPPGLQLEDANGTERLVRNTSDHLRALHVDGRDRDHRLGRGKKATVAYGTLTDSSGTPLSGVWVQLTQGSNTAAGQTGADGQYIFYDGENCATASFVTGCTGASTSTWNFGKGTGSTKIDILGDAFSYPVAPAVFPTYPMGKTSATIKSGTTTFATLSAPNGYTFSVANGNAYNRDWKFGP